MHRMIKRLGAVAVIFLLLSGCTQQAVQKEQEEQTRQTEREAVSHEKNEVIS